MEHVQELMKEITIGRNKYNYLKSLKSPTDEDLKLIELYESKHSPTIQNPEKFAEYWNKVWNVEEGIETKINAHRLIKVFINNYKKFYDKEFVMNKETEINLYTIAFYFAKDEGFFRSPNIVEEVQIGTKIKTSKPSFDKGLLIIGNFGNGKSSMLKTFCKTLQNVRDYNFSFRAANDLVSDYGCLQSPEEKKNFWHGVGKLRLLIDDAKTEGVATNFGKIDLVKHLIETRADKRLITHIICNFKAGFRDDIPMAIAELGEKYGSRSLDRIFGNYNIIHFKGKSFRQ